MSSAHFERPSGHLRERRGVDLPLCARDEPPLLVAGHGPALFGPVAPPGQGGVGYHHHVLGPDAVEVPAGGEGRTLNAVPLGYQARGGVGGVHGVENGSIPLEPPAPPVAGAPLSVKDIPSVFHLDHAIEFTDLVNFLYVGEEDREGRGDGSPRVGLWSRPPRITGRRMGFAGRRMVIFVGSGAQCVWCLRSR